MQCGPHVCVCFPVQPQHTPEPPAPEPGGAAVGCRPANPAAQLARGVNKNANSASPRRGSQVRAALKISQFLKSHADDCAADCGIWKS